MFNRKWVVAGLMTIAMVVAACGDDKIKGFQTTEGENLNAEFSAASTPAEYTALKDAYGKLGQEGKVGVGFCELLLGNPAAAATAFASITTDDKDNLANIPARDRALDRYAGWAFALYATSATAADEVLAIDKAKVVLDRNANYTSKLDARIDKNDVALVAASLYLKAGANFSVASCAAILNKIDPAFKLTSSHSECLIKVQTLSTVGLLQ